MNDINQRQNTFESLSLLKLQRYKYNQVSKWEVTQFLLAVVVPVIISIIELFNIPTKMIVFLNFLGVLGIVVLFISEYFTKKCKTYAAQVQYIFDTRIYGMKQNKLISKLVVDELLVESKNDKIQNITGVENWYSIEDNLELNNAIFSCQKQNIYWDTKLRKLYRKILIYICSIALLTIVLIPIFKDLLFNVWMYCLLFIAGNIGYFLKYFGSINENLKEQNELMNVINEYQSKTKLSLKELQDLEEKIYYYRTNLVKIPNWIYNITKKKMQEEADYRAKLESEKYK